MVQIEHVRFYRPKLALAASQPSQDRLISKLGGQPWGFPESRWPVCSNCGYPMSLVAQLEHEPPMVDLGQRSVLHLFYCANLLCMSYGVGGCEALVLKCEEIGSGLTEQPPDLDGDRSINDELWIVGWEAHDDAVSSEQVSSFYNDRDWMKLPEEIAWPFDSSRHWSTKAAGVPYWTGNGVTLDPSHIRCPPFEFLLQIHQFVDIADTPPIGVLTDSKAHIYENTNLDGEVSYCVDFVNFGSDGTGFVFIDRSQTPPLVRWYWSR